MATGLEKSVFITIPRKGNAKECTNYYTIALISQASKVMLKILQARLQQYVNREHQMFKLDLGKAEETEIKLPTSIGSSKKQESYRKTSTSFLYCLCQSLWLLNHNKPWKILKEMGIPDHLTCLLRNLYVGQKATERYMEQLVRLVPNWERSTSRLYIVTMLI